MSFKITGKNFQAWEQFEIEVENLTVIVGPSNEGKSSLFRAIRGLIRNELTQQQIRIGSDGMELTLEYDGHVVKASRSGTSSTEYVIDGTEFKKLHRAIPKELEDLLWNEVHIGDIDLDPCFARQGKPQFLLEEQPTALNAIIGAFASTERLEQGKREANRRMAEKSAEAKTLGIEARECEALKSILTTLADRAQVIESSIANLTPVIQHDEALAAELVHYARVSTRHKELVHLLDRFTVPETTDLAQDIWMFEALSTTIEAMRKRARLIQVIERIGQPDASAADRDAAIVEHLGHLIVSRRRIERAERFFSVVEQAVKSWVAITDQYRHYKALGERVQLLKVQGTGSAKWVLKRLEDASQEIYRASTNGQSNQRIIQFAGEAIEARKLLERLSWELKQATDEMLAKELEIARLDSTIKREEATMTCPKCGERFIPLDNQGNPTNQAKEHIHA